MNTDEHYSHHHEGYRTTVGTITVDVVVENGEVLKPLGWVRLLWAEVGESYEEISDADVEEISECLNANAIEYAILETDENGHDQGILVIVEIESLLACEDTLIAADDFLEDVIKSCKSAIISHSAYHSR